MAWNYTMASTAGFMWITWNPCREQLEIIPVQVLLLLPDVARNTAGLAAPSGRGSGDSLCANILEITRRCRRRVEGITSLRWPEASHRRWVCRHGTTTAGPLRARLLPVFRRAHS